MDNYKVKYKKFGSFHLFYGHIPNKNIMYLRFNVYDAAWGFTLTLFNGHSLSLHTPRFIKSLFSHKYESIYVFCLER